MALTVTAASKPKPGKSPRVGLALAGGGPVGGMYEVGALVALDEALKGIDLHELDIYVGVSAGALIASNLVNGMSTSQMAKILVQNTSVAYPISTRVFHTLNFRGYLQGLKLAPAALAGSLANFLRTFPDTGPLGALAGLSRAIPSGVFTNEPVRRWLEDLYRGRGRTNDFRKLKRKLLVIATDLNSGESVCFGGKGFEHVPIAQAVQASTALPGLYPPVEIDGHYYLDGALKRTLHASVALDDGADLLLCINPIVPYDASLERNNNKHRLRSLTEGGLPVILSQTFRTMVHSRMEVGMEKYATSYPDRDILLMEPDRHDSRMFFTNLFSYSRRLLICQHAYETTRMNLLAQSSELRPLLARHGLRLDMKILRQKDRHFSAAVNVPEAVTRHSRRKNMVTNQLSNTLDMLQAWARK